MQESILNHMNNKELEELNPLVNKGYRLVRSRTLPTRMKIENAKGVIETTRQQLLLNVYVKEGKKRDRHGTHEAILIDFLSEQDLYFQFRVEQNMGKSRLTESEFRRIREQQELVVEYKDFLTLLFDLFDEVEKKKKTADIEIINDKKAVFSFQSILNGKRFNLLTLELYREEEQVVKELVAYRYGYLRAQVAKLQGRSMDVRQIIRVKNPYLLRNFDQF